MYKLLTTPQFDRRLAKFRKAHSSLKDKLGAVFRDLETDPFQPHLRLHPLMGELKGLHAISVTHAYRITLTLMVSKKEITLLDIGSHDEVYR